MAQRLVSNGATAATGAFRKERVIDEVSQRGHTQPGTRTPTRRVGGFTISNAGSHEEAMAGLVSYPLYGFFDWEVKPLCEWSSSYDLFVQEWKQLAG